MDPVAGLADRLANAASPAAADCFYECVECGNSSGTARTTCPGCDGLVVRVVEP